MSRIAVIGAGVVGVTSAYALARAGHQVTLVDAAAGPGLGASAGNAAQLSWAYGDAMASPALLRHLPAVLLGRDPAFRVDWQVSSDFLRWGLAFLANTPGTRWWRNSRAVLALAAESRQALASLLNDMPLNFAYRQAGKMHLYADAASFAASERLVACKAELGIRQLRLSRAEAEEIEPGLRHYAAEIAGVVYTPGDAVGDAAQFCQQLTAALTERFGVRLMFGRRMTAVLTRAGRCEAIAFADSEPLVVDQVVIAAGPMVRDLRGTFPELRRIWPVRGYSLTIPRPQHAPDTSLTDVTRKLAFAAIGDRYRVAGLADIVRPGSSFDPARCRSLEVSAAGVLPSVFTTASDALRWSGERPMTPDSRPTIAASRTMRGVFLNVGHGMLGWTLALGSAHRLLQLIEGRG